jgi:hypothetical protein
MVLGFRSRGWSAQAVGRTCAVLVLSAIVACTQSSDSGSRTTDGPAGDRATNVQSDSPWTEGDASGAVDSASELDAAADTPLDLPADNLPGMVQDGSAVDGGWSCSKAGDCPSGFCVKGVCCDRACTGVCEYCPRATADGRGTCMPVPAGMPFESCEAESAATCGRTGFCDGNGACALFPANTICGSAICSGNVLATARTCDGSGYCRGGQLQDCAPYGCESGACRSACSEPSSKGCTLAHDASTGQ